MLAPLSSRKVSEDDLFYFAVGEVHVLKVRKNPRRRNPPFEGSFLNRTSGKAAPLKKLSASVQVSHKLLEKIRTGERALRKNAVFKDALAKIASVAPTDDETAVPEISPRKRYIPKIYSLKFGFVKRGLGKSHFSKRHFLKRAFSNLFAKRPPRSEFPLENDVFYPSSSALASPIFSFSISARLSKCPKLSRA